LAAFYPLRFQQWRKTQILLCRNRKRRFQTSSPWIPEIDVRSDIAIVYGTNDHNGITFEQRVKSWRDHGYEVNFMTGIAWGDYYDYFLGKWDGKNHLA
jgi:hypothetical protein